jgi:carbamoyl-phosphate synthase large subunit
MKTVNVLVTSAGVSSALNVIKSLRLQNEFSVSICAVDMDPLAPGLYLAEFAYVSPPISDVKKYLDFLFGICDRHHINALYPCYSKELSVIAREKEAFDRIGVKTLLPAPETIDLCNDKRKFTEFARGLGLTVPKTFSTDEVQNIPVSEFPLFVKPVTGSSSTGAVKLDDKKALDYYLYQNKDVLIQQFVEGQEITVDVFCNRSSKPLVIAPRIRLSTKGGQSIKGKTINNKDFIEPVTTLCQALSLQGVCNIQFIMSKVGIVFIELNPRYAAGGLMLTVHAGANIPVLALKTMLGYDIKENECKTKLNIYMTRYWEEIFTKNDSLPPIRH